jgi:hypothetical protein
MPMSLREAVVVESYAGSNYVGVLLFEFDV